MAIKVSRLSRQNPKAPSRGAAVIATGEPETSVKIPEGTSSDARAALVGRYTKAKKKRKGGKGCCPGKRGY